MCLEFSFLQILSNIIKYRHAYNYHVFSAHMKVLPDTWLSTLETVYLCLSEDTNSRWSLLSGAYARGSKRSHTEGKYNLSWTPHSNLEKDNSLNHPSVSSKMVYKEYITKNKKNTFRSTYGHIERTIRLVQFP